MNATPLSYILSLLYRAAILAAIIYAIIKYIKRPKKTNAVKPPKTRNIPSTVCIVIAAVSWILNMGWYRVVFTWLAIPIIHPIIFKIVNIRFAKLVKLTGSTLKTKFLSVLSCATYLLAYLLLPDGGDIGSAYMFFALIHSNKVEIFLPIAILFFLANIAVMIIQFANTKQLQDTIKVESKEQLENIK